MSVAVAGSVLMACVLFLGVDGSTERVGPALAREEADLRSPNVLFILLDTTPASRMSLYGYPRPTTPFIDSLASDALYFTHAHSQASATPSSTWSFMTSRYPYKFSSDLGPDFLLKVRPRRDTTMAEIFRDHGYATAGFVENPWISDRFGFDHGFDTYEYFEWKAKQRGPVDEIYFRTDGSTEAAVDAAAEWVDRNDASPWLCYVHLMRPHTPYLAPEPYRLIAADAAPELSTEDERTLAERERDIILASRKRGYVPPPGDLAFVSALYDGNLAYADWLVERLYRELRDKGQLENTIVVIASDHGEAFGEHGQMMHDNMPYEEVVHVPLILRFPDRFARNCGPIDGYVEMLDVLPTLLDAANIEGPPGMEGRSLMPRIEGADPIHKVFGFSHNIETRSVAVRLGDAKLLARVDRETREPVAFELYDLLRDPRELEPVREAHRIPPEMLERLEWYLDTREWTFFDEARNPKLSAQERAEVQALGYL